MSRSSWAHPGPGRGKSGVSFGANWGPGRTFGSLRWGLLVGPHQCEDVTNGSKISSMSSGSSKRTDIGFGVGLSAVVPDIGSYSSRSAMMHEIFQLPM